MAPRAAAPAAQAPVHIRSKGSPARRDDEPAPTEARPADAPREKRPRAAAQDGSRGQSVRDNVSLEERRQRSPQEAPRPQREQASSPAAPESNLHRFVPCSVCSVLCSVCIVLCSSCLSIIGSVQQLVLSSVCARVSVQQLLFQRQTFRIFEARKLDCGQLCSPAILFEHVNGCGLNIICTRHVH